MTIIQGWEEQPGQNQRAHRNGKYFVRKAGGELQSAEAKTAPIGVPASQAAVAEALLTEWPVNSVVSMPRLAKASFSCPEMVDTLTGWYE